MDVTMCDRCRKVLISGKDLICRIVKTDYNDVGIMGEHSRIDLCEACNEKFNKFMTEVDDREV